MARRGLLLTGLLILALIQLSAWPSAFGDRVLPAFMLAGVLAWGLSADLEGGFRWGLAGGIILDLYSGRQVGMYTLAFAASYLPLLALVRGRADDLTLGFRVALAVAAALLYELVVLFNLNLAHDRFPFFAELRDVATLNIVGTIAVWLLLLPLASRLNANLTPHARPLPQRSLSRN